MIANVSAHRRANAFAQALEAQTPQGTAADQPEETAEGPEPARLLALANGLGALPSPELDPEVKVVQRAQLIAAMEAMVAEGGVPTGPTVPEQRTGRGSHRASPLRKLRPRSRWSKGIAAGGLTVGVAAGAFSGVAAASSDALPGDSLYGLKRGMEDVKLGMAGDDADRGEIYLDQASTRLMEARRLMERGRAADLDHEQLGEVRRTLSGMTHDAGEGHRLLTRAYERDGSIGSIQALSSFAKSHRQAWSSLRERLPVQLADVGDQVSSVFDAIDEEVAPLQSLLPRAPKSPENRDRPSGSTQDRTGTPGTDRPAPSTSTSAGGRTGDDAKPKPSSPRSTAKEEGLLPGAPGDLLDPPSADTPAPSSPSSRDKGGPNTPPVPDVTVPPLLPGILPGLGIEEENAP
ncbi:hypothetical protein BGM19_21385 [Streptomyces agglomeratus]|uniref:DUF5667 domain-containing protein n=1 Tax=Streptomyces agglomeratus TaxID=285458 RepID=UPI00086E7CE8|nr:DUF5667 domain-containing protein [Streptomyces agglomeratus]OEJ60163.1 hypothetical protein BGM19_21385 [Streptomyces agglomeratus]